MRANCIANRWETTLREIPAYYREFENWPSVDESTIPPIKRARLRNLTKAAGLFLKGQPPSKVLEVAGVSERQFLNLLARALRTCVGSAEINGTRAFVRGMVQSSRIRTMLENTIPGGTAGFTGLFSRLFRLHPMIEKELTDWLNGSERPNKITPELLFKKFRLIAIKHQSDLGQYPNQTTKQGYAPIQHWYKNAFIPTNLNRHVRQQYGKDAAVAARFEQGDGTAKTPPPIYGVFVIDECRIDLETNLEIPSPRWDVEYVAVNCINILRCRAVGSIACNVSWHMCIQPQAAAADVIELFKNAVLGQPACPVVDPSMQYKDGAGFPANVFPKLKFSVPALVYLDNALSHLADALQHLLTRLFGGRVLLGKPGTPKGRPEIESAIGAFLKGVIHQLPSTTGKGPLDPVRKSSAVEVGKRVPIGLLEQCIDVYLANENVMESAGAGYLDSFLRLSRYLASSKVELTYLDEPKRKPHHFSAPIVKYVKCDLATGRLAHVWYLHRRYSSDWMKLHPELVGKKLWALVDYDDLRTLVLVDESMATFATVKCEGEWGRVPHDLRIIKIYGRHKAKAQHSERPGDIPLFCTLAYLAKAAPGDSGAAMDLAYVVRYLKRHVSADELQMIQEDVLFNGSHEAVMTQIQTERWTLETPSLPAVAARPKWEALLQFEVPRRLR